MSRRVKAPAVEVADWRPSKKTDWRRGIAYQFQDLTLAGDLRLPARAWTPAEVDTLDRVHRRLLTCASSAD